MAKFQLSSKTVDFGHVARPVDMPFAPCVLTDANPLIEMTRKQYHSERDVLIVRIKIQININRETFRTA